MVVDWLVMVRYVVAVTARKWVLVDEVATGACIESALLWPLPSNG